MILMIFRTNKKKQKVIIMKKLLLFIISMWMFSSSTTNAQAVQFPTMDLYDTDVMMMHLNAVREMNQRAILISQTVQPYREQQRQYIGKANIAKL